MLRVLVKISLATLVHCQNRGMFKLLVADAVPVAKLSPAGRTLAVVGRLRPS